MKVVRDAELLVELGTRISLRDGRLNLSLSRWTSDQTGQSTAIIRNQLGFFDFNGAIIQLWNVANQPSGDAKYLSPPYRLAQNFTGCLDNSAQFCEFTLTANPSRNWRLSLNGGTQTNHQTNLGPVLQRYWAEFSPLWRNFPSRKINACRRVSARRPDCTSHCCASALRRDLPTRSDCHRDIPWHVTAAPRIWARRLRFAGAG